MSSPAIRGLMLLMLAAFGALVVVASVYAERIQPGASIAAAGAFGVSVVVIAGCMGKPWALKVCLFVLILGMDMAFRSRASADMSVDGSVAYRLALWTVAFVVGVANLPASWRYFRCVSYGGLLAYLILAMLSAIYSISPRYSLGCAYGYLCIFPFMAAVVARLGLRDSLLVALLAIGVHVAAAVILWFTVPNMVTWRNWSGSEARLRGLLGHPFRMAEAASVFLLCGWIMWRQRWLATPAFGFVAAVGGLALLLTQTRSSIIAVALTLFSVGRFRLLGTATVAAMAMAALIIVNAVPGALEAIAFQASRAGSVEGTLTLTGRTYIWQESLRLFSERPILGYGFASTRTLFPDEFVTRNPKGEAPPHAHNMIVQSLVTTGIVGMLLLLIPLAVPVVHSLRHRDGLANPLTWYVAIAGMAGLGPVGSAPRSLTVFWMLSLLMVHWADQAAAGRYSAPQQEDNAARPGRGPVAIAAAQ